MSTQQDLLKQRAVNEEKLIKALYHLKESYKDIQNLSSDPKKLTEAELKAWDAYTVRFARVADIFLSRYIRTLVLLEDPGFQGTLRDYLNFAHKLEYIEDPEVWFEIRALRNISIHEYADEELQGYLQALKEKYPILVKIESFFTRSE